MLSTYQSQSYTKVHISFFTFLLCIHCCKSIYRRLVSVCFQNCCHFSFHAAICTLWLQVDWLLLLLLRHCGFCCCYFAAYISSLSFKLFVIFCLQLPFYFSFLLCDAGAAGLWILVQHNSCPHEVKCRCCCCRRLCRKSSNFKSLN